MKPPIRYVGGKSWLVDRLVPEIEAFKPPLYVEPFLGGAAIALAINPETKKLVSDTNAPLMEMWKAIRTAPRALVEELRKLEVRFETESPFQRAVNYLEARKEFNATLVHPRPFWVFRSALLIYLNARCYNGLWRVNQRGLFNVPYGKLPSPRRLELEEVLALSDRLKRADTQTSHYAIILKKFLPPGSAIYADPPYDGVYGGYDAGRFDENEQRQLAQLLHKQSEAGMRIWASNADTPLIREIYAWAKIEEIDEQHAVGPTGEQRGKRPCLLIRGQDPLPKPIEDKVVERKQSELVSIGAKVAYVKQQAQLPAGRHHTCHWPGCNRQVSPAFWGCLPHWNRLPHHLRVKIWNAYDPGQERTLTPSRDYIDAAHEVQEWIEQFGGV